ncbi:Mitochondrial import inner membrane translocase subunit TIM54 [Hypsizygus marmoreus]|uniref:Mitochondrial import inner membrane translocase subunit TIM54 n=1 Tax=Hypsizygus marmoreus TaxID=39966 RepID=A0A369JH65_HYPMA|nr:Mitochondrial import inner membrane translocase subunit TIM54 [Hypsizygus marmoreus]
MTDQNVTKSPPVVPKPPSGFQTALRYTGIPESWLNKRPKLPSRNWLIFLSVTSSIAGYYIYDRRQCKQIRQRYIDLVKDQAEGLVGPLYAPRKVNVYGAKWPGDEDYDQAVKYFRKYVKPILVAAAVDFEMFVGKRHGDIADRIANEVRLKRRMDLGVDKLSVYHRALPTYKPPDVARQYELDGGIVLIGRPTLKEFMAGLKRGWTEGLEKVDYEEQLARELEFDGHFDEPEEPSDELQTFSDASERRSIPNAQNSPVFSPLQMRPPPPRPPPSSASSTISDFQNAPPDTIPELPPLLLVSFTDHIGLSQVPIMIWEFFNRRHSVRSGAEAAYRLVMKSTRPIVPPEFEPESIFGDITTTNKPVNQGDLDFDKHVESFYKNSLNKIPAETEKARAKYYEALPAKLATARALARGTREPTKDEIANPPPTEVELAAERMKKELRWRRDVAGWEMIKPTQKVVWDERFQDAIRIFTDPSL